MKLSDRLSRVFTTAALAWLFPLLLIIPNIVLAFTEHDAATAKCADIFLPLGVYYLLMSASAAVGRTVIMSLPLMIFAAFQIVLLYLYGESIIAIDMFLNVATTNTKEVAELLSNLIIAIIIVLVVYLPPIIWGCISMIRKQRCDSHCLKSIRRAGALSGGIGLIFLIASYAFVPDFTIRRNIFPVNVIANLVDAINRTVDTSNYHLTSAQYKYSSTLTHDREQREVYVLIIGETSRADNWQLFGYGRPTNPRLSVRNGLITYAKTLSESNTTHKSVPMLLSPLTAKTFGDSIYYTKGICAAFNEAGFNTAFFSNQQRNHSFIDFFAQQAQTTEFIRDKEPEALDDKLVDHLREFISHSPSDKLFIILHCYGSHFNYRERYSTDCRPFVPDDASEATFENRSELINAYDNSIVFTDSVIDSAIALLDSLDLPAALMYTSDHGEDIFDDPRGRFLHASPTPTFTQIHVPMLLWISERYRTMFPDVSDNAEAHRTLNTSSSRSIFPTMMSIAGICSPKVISEDDLSSPYYTEKERLYLNDYNEAVDLRKAGFRKYDTQKAKDNNISLDL